MKKAKNLTNLRFGNWVVIKVSDTKEGYWTCICDCDYCKEYGNTIRDVLGSNLKKGISKSCGKLSRQKNGFSNKKINKYEFFNDYGVGYTSCGYKFYFDLEVYDEIKNYCWHKHQDGYLRTRVDRIDNKNIYSLMHVLIMGEKNIDHINGQPNDNRKKNLRKCTRQENMMNVKTNTRNKSGCKGVHYAINEGKWKAYICYNNKRIHLGTFVNKEDAINARQEAEIKYFGEFLRIEGNNNDV
jgi:hypothetical protein